MIKMLLTSSNYKLCMCTSSIIQLMYLYGIYHTGIYFYCNLSGIVLFTLIEYIYHRYILHYTNDGELYYYLHGKHHLKPHSMSLHVPILFLIILHVISYYTLSYISHHVAVNVMCMAQFSYIIFEHLHMEAHHPYFLKHTHTFRISHLYHHSHTKKLAYAFSSPTWDIVFGTFPHEVLTYNWFALIPIPFLSYYIGTAPHTKTISSS
jgi:sterol desaturase/sphingolipid hydroxylase (fatty acid hydroxylase superfamily)